jgi:hypothetical protein
MFWLLGIICIIKMSLFQNTGTEYDEAMPCAAKNGHFEIVKHCKERGAIPLTGP